MRTTHCGQSARTSYGILWRAVSIGVAVDNKFFPGLEEYPLSNINTFYKHSHATDMFILDGSFTTVVNLTQFRIIGQPSKENEHPLRLELLICCSAVNSNHQFMALA